MANILVCVELRDRRPTPPSLFAVGEARRLSSSLGATVYAVAAAEATVPVDALAVALGHAGADKILLADSPAAASCPIYPLWGPLLEPLATALRPGLVLFPAGAFGLQLAAPLAAALDAPLAVRAVLALEPDPDHDRPRLLARRWCAERDGLLTLEVGAGGAPTVLTLGAGWPRPASPGAAEVQALATPPASGSGAEALASDEDGDQGDDDLADLVIVASASDRPGLRAAAAPLPGVLVPDEAQLARLDQACPRLVLSLLPRPKAETLGPVALTPAGHLAAAGTRRTRLPHRLHDRLWLVKRAEAVPQLRAALTALARHAGEAEP